MRLAVKLMVVFLAAILVVTGVYGYFAVQREEQIFIERASAEAERLAARVEPTVRGVWEQYGPERAVAYVREMPLEGYQVLQVRWVWFDAPPNDPHGPSMPIDVREFRAIRQVVSVAPPEWRGPENLFAYRPLNVTAGRQGGLEFAYSVEELTVAKRRAIYETLRLLAALVAVTGFAVVAAGVTMVGHPLRELTEKTRRIAKGDLSGPLHLSTGDELSTLAASLNDLCVRLDDSQQQVREETTSRIAALEQLRHADRLRTVGRLASGIAHELGTPLNVISGHAEIMSRQLPGSPLANSAEAIKREADRMAAIIRQLLDFARRRNMERSRADLRQIVQQTAGLLQPLAAKRDIQIVSRLGEAPAWAMIDVGQIQQVLTNVLMNALQASPAAASIDVGIEQRSGVEQRGDSDSESLIAVSVQDHGPGIPSEQLQQIFEPFFTTKEVGDGTGLGLSIAYRILEEHGGDIEVASEPGAGSRFTVLLPAAGGFS